MKRLNQFLYYAKELLDSEDKASEFDYLWKILDVLISKDWKEVVWTLEQIEEFTALLKTVLEVVPPRSYALRLPVIKKILWFCDDVLKAKNLNRASIESISSLHDFVLEFRADNASFFTKHKRNILLDFEPEIIKEMDKHFTTTTSDNAIESTWLLADESELQKHFAGYLGSCNEEKDFEDFSKLLFKTFYSIFNERHGFSDGYDAFIGASRKVIFQTRKHNLMFDLLDYLPLAIESAYSYPYNIKKQKCITQLSGDLILMIRQIKLHEDHSDRLNSLLNQYYRFFFHYLKIEKIDAFEAILKVFVAIMESRSSLFNNSGFDGEMSEVYFSLTSKSKVEFKLLLQNYLVDSLKYSRCFITLFPQLVAKSEDELDHDSVLNETLKEVLKDGVIDEDERKILLQVFSLLKLDKSVIKERIDTVKSQLEKTGFSKEALDPKSLMLKILHVAFLDGKLSSEEKGFIQTMGTILGLEREMMRQMIYEMQYASQQTTSEPAILSVFTINPEFEKGISSFKEESLQLEESARALSGLLKNNDLSLEGDQVNFGDVKPIKMQVEIQKMHHELGLFFFVKKQDSSYLKELLKHLEYIVVEEGESSSKIVLNLLSGKQVIIMQNEGIQIAGDFQEVLNKNLGSIKVLIVDQEEQELMNVFSSSYSIVTKDRYDQIIDILSEENPIRFQMFSKKMKREFPGDRFWRTVHFEYVLKHDLVLDKLRDMEAEYDFVCSNDSEDFRSHYLMAMIFLNAGRVDDALKCLKRSILENPSYLKAILEICKLLLKSNNQRELLFYFKYLEVYYWEHEEVRSLIDSINEEDWSLLYRNLIKTPFNLLFSTKKYAKS